MIVECTVISALILVILVFFLRTKKQYIPITFTLLFVPVSNILAALSFDLSRNIVHVNKLFLYIVFNILALVVSGIVIGIQCYKIPTHKIKIYYSCLILVFNIVLSILLIYNVYIIL